MRYTLRNIPTDLDRALRERARREGRSLNDVAIAAMAASLGLGDGKARFRDLGDIRSSGNRSSGVDEAVDTQRRIDPDLWR